MQVFEEPGLLWRALGVGFGDAVDGVIGLFWVIGAAPYYDYYAPYYGYRNCRR
jgi:hypothetical protein